MSEADFQPLIAWLQLHPNWVFTAVLLISFVESLALAGVIVPGVLLLFLVSALAGHLELPLTLILLAGFVGAVLGDGISFFLGHYFKESLRGIWPFSRYPKTLELGEQFFHKHGGKSVVLGRFIGPIRPVIPIVAGMLGMSQLRFTIFNATSALVWAPFYILPGYLTGSAARFVLPENFYPAIISLLMALIIIGFVFRYLSIGLQQGAPFYEYFHLRIRQNVQQGPSRKLATGDTGTQDNSPLTEKPLPPPQEFPLASLALFVSTSLSFVIWSFVALKTHLLNSLDQLVLLLSSELRNMPTILAELGTRAFIHLTLLGNEGFLYISFIILISLMLYLRQYRAAILLTASGLSTAAITHFLKASFMIARPEIVLLPPTSFAYPSGHSSGSTVFYGLIAAFIAQTMSQNQRWKCYLLFFVPMALIALSRVMLSVHWFSDVIGGVLLGLALCGLSRAIYSRYMSIDRLNRREESKTKRAIVVTAFTWVLACILFQLTFFEQALVDYQLLAR